MQRVPAEREVYSGGLKQDAAGRAEQAAVRVKILPTAAGADGREDQYRRRNHAEGEPVYPGRGVFAFIKEDMDFRRFMLRGTVHVAAEWMLLSFAYNFWKLHHKIQNGRLGDHLKNPRTA